MHIYWRQRQADLCAFEMSLVYTLSSREVEATQSNPVSKKKKKIKLGVAKSNAWKWLGRLGGQGTSRDRCYSYPRE